MPGSVITNCGDIFVYPAPPFTTITPVITPESLVMILVWRPAPCGYGSDGVKVDTILALATEGPYPVPGFITFTEYIAPTTDLYCQ